MAKIRILIADDHAVVRSGLQQLLGQQGDMEVVGEAADGREVLDAVKSQKPDVLILDVAMPHMSGLEVVNLVREASPACQVVVLTMYGKESFVHRVLEGGALGYVLKASPATDVVEAVRAAHRGEYFLSSRIRADVVGAYLTNRKQPPTVKGYDLLSEREQQVFRLVAEGNSTNQIADLLCVSPKTVEKHRTNIMRKLGVKDRLDVVKLAVKIGIIDPQLWEG